MHFNLLQNRITSGAIVFIHGNSSSSRVFQNALESELITFSKVTIDLPGHGDSVEGYNTLEKLSLKTSKSRCISLINNLEDDILLVGHSYGGHVAIEIAEDIERLKGLVIFGSPPIKKPVNLEEAYLPFPESSTFFSEAPSDLEIEAVANLTVYNKCDVNLIVEDFKNTNPMVRPSIVKDISEGNFGDEYDLFTNLNVPKFIINGKHDPIMNLEYLKQVQGQCKNSCELIEFDECGHYPSIEKPIYFNKIINEIAIKVFTV